MPDFEEICRLPRRAHDDLFRRGAPPAIDDLVGFDFCGWNCSLVPRLAGFRKFLKGFVRRPGHGPDAAEGFNVAVIQNGLDGDWLGLPADDEPRRFGFYTVTPAGRRVAGAPADALLLDYGAHASNPRLDPSRLLRDVVVAVDRDLLLGRAHLDLGFWAFAGYFVLRRRKPLGD